MPKRAKGVVMERLVFKVANQIILWSMIVFFMVLNFGRPLVENLARSNNDGGIMAAVGYWNTPEDDRHGPMMNPGMFLLGATISSFATCFFLSKKWKSMTPEEGRFYYISSAMTLILALMMVGCMFARYHAWHSQ